MSNVVSLNYNNTLFQDLNYNEYDEISGGSWTATAWGVAKAAALLGGSAILVTGAVVAAGYIVYKVVT